MWEDIANKEGSIDKKENMGEGKHLHPGRITIRESEKLVLSGDSIGAQPNSYMLFGSKDSKKKGMGTI